MLDSHCHLDDPRFHADLDAVERRAREAGVDRFLVPGTDAAQWPALRRLAATRGWRFALGTHPWRLPATTGPAGENPAVLPDDLTGAAAVGECGLDAAIPVPLEAQTAVLHAHLALARDAGLPVILHCVRAHDRLLAVLREFGPLRGVVHSYSGGADRVDAYVALGLHLSFGGAITWERARRPVDSLRRVPLHRLLLETDAPDQCPRPHHGRSEPAHLPLILAAAEGHRGEPLAATLDENAAALGW